MYLFSLSAGEFWRSIRIPESSAIVLLDMCIFPHCDHVYSGLRWCVLPDCPRAYVPCIFPPCWFGKFIQLPIFFSILQNLCCSVWLFWFFTYCLVISDVSVSSLL
jgi:hypothetical protein